MCELCDAIESALTRKAEKEHPEFWAGQSRKAYVDWERSQLAEKIVALLEDEE